MPLLTAADIGRFDESTSNGGGSVLVLSTEGALELNSTVNTFTANGNTPVVVSDTRVNADSVILIGLKTVGGTPAAVFQTAVTAGTSFTVNSTAGNTSVYNYRVL